MRHIVIIALLGLYAAILHAEIEKIATTGSQGIDFFWWPKLEAVSGWHHERGPSLNYGANALAPDGHTFGDAETVIYARAIYKPRAPEAESLAIFIERDHRDFAKNSPAIQIEEASTLTTGDGKKLRSFTFTPTADGNWEQVAYGEEGDFYLVFTVSSRTSSGLQAALPTYLKLVAQYKEVATQPVAPPAP